MGRREINSTPQDPESEEARQERDSIVGDKDKAQSDMVTIAANIKRLKEEEDFEKARIEKELSSRRDDFNSELAHFSKIVSDKKSEIASLETKESGIKSSIESLSRQHSSHIESASSSEMIRDEVQAKVDTLRTTEKSLESSISQKQSEIGVLEEKKNAMQSTVTSLDVKSTSLLAKIDEDTKRMLDLEFDMKNGNLNVTEASNRLQSIVSEISTKNVELSHLKVDIDSAKKDLEACKSECEKRDRDTNEKVKALTLLEARVDERLEILARFKDKFTTDELAKIKMHTDLTK